MSSVGRARPATMVSSLVDVRVCTLLAHSRHFSLAFHPACVVWCASVPPQHRLVGLHVSVIWCVGGVVIAVSSQPNASASAQCHVLGKISILKVPAVPLSAAGPPVATVAFVTLAPLKVLLSAAGPLVAAVTSVMSSKPTAATVFASIDIQLARGLWGVVMSLGIVADGTRRLVINGLLASTAKITQCCKGFISHDILLELTRCLRTCYNNVLFAFSFIAMRLQPTEHLCAQIRHGFCAAQKQIVLYMLVKICAYLCSNIQSYKHTCKGIISHDVLLALTRC